MACLDYPFCFSLLSCLCTNPISNHVLVTGWRQWFTLLMGLALFTLVSIWISRVLTDCPCPFHLHTHFRSCLIDGTPRGTCRLARIIVFSHNGRGSLRLFRNAHGLQSTRLPSHVIWCDYKQFSFHTSTGCDSFFHGHFFLVSSCSLVFLASFERLLVSLYLLRIKAPQDSNEINNSVCLNLSYLPLKRTSNSMAKRTQTDKEIPNRAGKTPSRCSQ